MKNSSRQLATTVLCLVLTWLWVSEAAAADPLPSWHDGATKQAIVAFVEKVSTEGDPAFIPAEERIATFDNDGTLWVEKPLYIHFFGVLERLKAHAAADPALAGREPYKSVLTKDYGYFAELYENAAYASLVGQLLGVPFGGMTDAQYANWGRDFAASFKHPRFGTGVENLIYQPMLELMRYLEDNEFKVYIFTADEGAFVRLLANDLYGLPSEQVHGSSVRSEFITTVEGPRLVRTYRLQYLNNWDGKPRLIQSVIGKPPVFAAGNSNGDQHMLQYAAETGGMSILIHHTDGEREYAYDTHTDKVMPLAQKEDWTVVDMKRNWRQVFPSGD